MGGEEREGQEQPCDDANGSEVARGRAGHIGSKEPALEWDPVTDLLFEARPPFGDEVVTGILGPIPRRSAGRLRGRWRMLGPSYRLPGDVELGPPGASGEILDRVPVAVTGCEVHGAEGAAGAEQFVDQADALEERRPVDGRHHPQTGDHVAERHIRRRLALVFHAHELIGRRPQRRQPFLEPRQTGRRLGILLTQALDELYGKGDRQRGNVERPEGQRSGRSPADAEQLVRQRVGVMAGGASLHDPLGQAPEILHEHDPQGDGDGPELADGQRLHALESADEALERLGLEVAVGVRDEGPGETQDARVAVQGALRELGELAVESTREVLSDLAQDLFDDVEVVDEPLRGRRDRAFLSDHRGDRAIALEQHAPAVSHPR